MVGAPTEVARVVHRIAPRWARGRCSAGDATWVVVGEGTWANGRRGRDTTPHNAMSLMLCARRTCAHFSVSTGYAQRHCISPHVTTLFSRGLEWATRRVNTYQL